ncbi:MAG: TetR family transcriptional regulator [Acetobacteraceae bacterium]
MSEPADPSAPLDDSAFDQALVSAAFQQAAALGWRNVQIGAAACAVGLSVARARQRFPSRAALLVRFARLADAAALAEPAQAESVRDRLFGMLMRRLDVFQAHRAGVLALLGGLPYRPQTTVFLAVLTGTSMRWALDAAGASTVGVAGRLRIKGLIAVWLWTLRAWQRDQTTDLAPTMATLDAALGRAERTAAWLSSLHCPGATATSSPGEAAGTGKDPPDDPADDTPFHSSEPSPRSGPHT